MALLEVRAGSPPSAVEMIQRYFRIRGLEELHEIWVYWERGSSPSARPTRRLPALVFFRSPLPEHSWVTAAGAVLDAASLRASTIDMEREPRAELCIRAGYIALRRIAEFFRIPYDPDPDADRPHLDQPRRVRRGVRPRWPSGASRSRPTATRRGATSPGGG